MSTALPPACIPLELFRAFASELQRTRPSRDEAEQRLQEVIQQARQGIGSAIPTEWLEPRLDFFRWKCLDLLEGWPSQDEARQGVERALDELAPLSKGCIEWDPDRVRPQDVLRVAQALREALRPCVSEKDRPEQEHQARVWLGQLALQLNPDDLPRERQGGYRGSPVVRRALTDLRSVYYEMVTPRVDDDEWDTVNFESTTDSQVRKATHVSRGWLS